MKRAAGWLLAVAAVAALFVDARFAEVAALAAAVAAALVLDRRALVAVARVGLVLALLFSSVLAGAVVAWSRDWVSGLAAAGAMLVRLLVFLILAALLPRGVDAEALLRLTRRLGMARLGLVLGLGLNVLPHLGDALRQVVIAWRVRRRSAAGTSPSLLALVEVLLAHVARIADDAAAAAALRGHAALLQRPVIEAASVPVIVATGRPGSGKTTAVLATARRFRETGSRLAGFAQPARMEDGRKTGFNVRDLVTGEEVLFAEEVARRQGDFGTRFRFRAEGFALAARALARVRGGDLLVVDELGPLELRGQGHLRAVQRALRVPGLRGALIVVRRQLVPALLAELDANDAEVVEITAERGERALEAALRRARGGSAGPRRRKHSTGPGR